MTTHVNIELKSVTCEKQVSGAFLLFGDAAITRNWYAYTAPRNPHTNTVSTT